LDEPPSILLRYAAFFQRAGFYHALRTSV